MELFDAIRTTRAMRRLDPSRDVRDADIATMIEAAAAGPSGGHRQPLQWIVVRDREIRRTLGAIYRRVSEQVDGVTPTRDTPLQRSITYLARHLADAPVLLVAIAEGEPDLRQAASIYPSVQNLMLAARSLGLGTTLTMRHRLAEDAVRSALGIPSGMHTYCLIPVGYPKGKWAARRGSREPIVHRDRYGVGTHETPRG